MSKDGSNGTPNPPAVPPLQPARFDCPDCKISYSMGAETTVYVYLKQVWFNHFVTACVKCGREYTAWYITVAEIQYLMKHNMGDKTDLLQWVTSDFCDDIKIIREFCEDNHKPFNEDLWLSPRRARAIDSQVAWFAYLLDHGEEP